MPSRPALVALARNGDPAAFEALAAELIGRLHAIAALLVHDRVLADDAVQETLVKVWRDLPRLRDPERFDGWLNRVLAHTCLDLVRRERGRRADPLPALIADEHRLDAEVADRDAVDRALGTLSPRHRAALVLRHYAGLSVEEVAHALKVPVGTAKSRLHYAEEAMHAAVDADMRYVPERGMA